MAKTSGHADLTTKQSKVVLREKNLVVAFCSNTGSPELGYFNLELELFQAPSLEQRRLYFDLCTMFKIVHSLCYFPPDIIRQHHATRATRATSNHPEHLYFAYPSFHTNQFQNSFIIRSIEAWNSLPLDLLSCSLSSFKLNVWSQLN